MVTVAAAVPMAQAQETQPPPAPRADAAGMPASWSSDAALEALRSIEAQRSVGRPLTGDERKVLAQLLLQHPDANVRAQAASILPWMPANSVGKATLKALTDESPLVRLRAMTALQVLVRSADPSLRQAAESASAELLQDPDDEVACAAGRVYHRLAPEAARRAMLRMASSASDVRYACFAQQAALPARDIDVAPPKTPKRKPRVKKKKTPKPGDGVRNLPVLETDKPLFEGGDALFIASFTATGMVTGALAPATLFPARDVLTYTRSRSQWAHEELSVATGVVGSLVLGAAMGGAAYGVTQIVGPLTLTQASTLSLSTAAGAMAGMGVGRMFQLRGLPLAGSVLGFEAVGLAVGASYAALVDVSVDDVVLSGAAGVVGGTVGTLAALAAVPHSPRLFVDGPLPSVPMFDFALGAGLAAGGVASLAAMLTAPVWDVNAGRVASAAASGATLAGAFVAVTYVALPVEMTARGQIAAGVGLVGQFIGLGAGFILLPESWAKRLSAQSAAGVQGAISLHDGQLQPGLPRMVTLAPAAGQTTPAVTMSLFEGRF